MNKDQLIKLLGKAKQHGTWEKDLVGFGLLVVAEMERIRKAEERRFACLTSGGHHFEFHDTMPTGEWVIENGKWTISGWSGFDVKCRTCDAWLVINYQERP